MIMLRPMVVQLRLDLTESPAPAAALWELVGEDHRQAAIDAAGSADRADRRARGGER